MNLLKVAIKLTLGTAFHTTGNRRRFGVGKALALDADGNPTIPATTLKGYLRERAELLLCSWGHRVCLGPEPERMCDGSQPCLVCLVFGNPRHPSPLRLADAQMEELLPASVIRSGVSISRYRRAAYPQLLFFEETTPPVSTTWLAEGEGGFASEQEAKQAAAILLLASHWGFAIGGGRTRGLGWIKDIRMTFTLDGTEIPEEQLTRFWQAWKEGKDVAED